MHCSYGLLSVWLSAGDKRRQLPQKTAADWPGFSKLVFILVSLPRRRLRLTWVGTSTQCCSWQLETVQENLHYFKEGTSSASTHNGHNPWKLDGARILTIPGGKCQQHKARTSSIMKISQHIWVDTCTLNILKAEAVPGEQSKREDREWVIPGPSECIIKEKVKEQVSGE